MTHSRTFPPRAESVRAARQFAAQILADLPPEALEPIELMVSELATNSVRHGATAFELTIVSGPDEIRVEVHDSADGTPTMRWPTPEELSGRGLQIVNMLADAWGVRPAAGAGKTVWLTVARGRTASACA